MRNPLADVAHGPWPVPAGPWIMHQSWHDVLFVHWPVPASSLRAVIPPSLAIDTFHGEAWLGLIAFHLRGIRLRGLPPIPFTSALAELNVRTYVAAGGAPGVYFLSMDATNPIGTAIANRWFRLVYVRAKVTVEAGRDGIRFASQRTHSNAPPAEFAALYRPISAPCRPAPGSLEHWLTERYCYYTVDGHRRIYRGDVHHSPWPLQEAGADILCNTMGHAHGLELPRTGHLTHYARRMDALIWPVRRLGPRGT